MRRNTTGIVENLTTGSRHRHDFDTEKRAVGFAVAGVLLACLGMAETSGAATSSWQATEEISATAESFIQGRIGTQAQGTSARATRLDSRHRLAKCDQPLQAFMRRGTEIKARTVVGVRCSGPKPWKVYVPVDVTVTATVLVSRMTLPPGHELAANDLFEEQRDVSRLLSGYITDKSQVSGQRLKTQLIAGKILTPRMLQAVVAIRRGQTVTLTANNGGYEISTSGTALSDGALNQRIRVENKGSGRVVEGIVRTRQHVEVLVASNNHIFEARPKVSPQVADTGFSNNDR